MIRLSLPGVEKISDSSNRYLTEKISKDLASNIKDETLLNLCLNTEVVTQICGSDEFWLLKLKNMSEDVYKLYKALVYSLRPVEFYKSLMSLHGLHNNIIFPMKVISGGMFFINPARTEPLSVLVDMTDSNKPYYTLIPDIYIYEVPNSGVYRKIGYDRGINTYQKWSAYISNEVLESIDKKDIDKYLAKMAMTGMLQVSENLDTIGEDLVATNRMVDIPFKKVKTKSTN